MERDERIEVECREFLGSVKTELGLTDRTRLKHIERLCESVSAIWDSPVILSWFPEHGVSHSAAIVRMAAQIMAPVTKAEGICNRVWNEDAKYVFACAALAHDIGMQRMNLVRQHSGEMPLSARDYQEIRKLHPKQAFNSLVHETSGTNPTIRVATQLRRVIE